MSEPSGESDLALLRRFPALSGRLPRCRLTRLPTGVELLDRVSATLGAPLWVKRDDGSGPLYGGNKPRKLEFLLGDALSRGRRVVVTSGGTGTNHGLATAICARHVGLETILLLLEQPVTENVRRSLLLDFAAGAEMYWGKSIVSLVARGLSVCGGRLLRGQVPYIVPTGGTSTLGTIGYVNAAFELAEQVTAGEIPEPTHIFLPMGSGGTAAGLAAGLALAGLRSKVVAVVVTDILPPSIGRLRRMGARVVAHLGRLDPRVLESATGGSLIEKLDGYVGGGYGSPSDQGRAAADLMADLEGIRLDSTYTAKCFAAIVETVRSGRYGKGPLLFWNTYSSVDPSLALGHLPHFRQLPPAFHHIFEGPESAAAV